MTPGGPPPQVCKLSSTLAPLQAAPTATISSVTLTNHFIIPYLAM
jgi:hypothetical protein